MDIYESLNVDKEPCSVLGKCPDRINISVYLATIRTQLQDNKNMQALYTISKLDKIAYG